MIMDCESVKGFHIVCGMIMSNLYSTISYDSTLWYGTQSDIVTELFITESFHSGS